MTRPVLIVVGAGPGVSGSVTRRFAREGYDAGLLGIDETELVELATSLPESTRCEHVVADLTDVDAAHKALTGLAEAFGRVDVLHFNPSAFRAKDPLSLTVPELLQDVALGVGGLLTALQATRPFMEKGSRISVTGSMAADQPSEKAASLGVQKAGVRNLVRSIDQTLAPDGIRAVSVTVWGSLGTEGPFTRDRVADAIHAAVHQEEADWRAEVAYRGKAAGERA